MSVEGEIVVVESREDSGSESGSGPGSESGSGSGPGFGSGSESGPGSGSESGFDSGSGIEADTRTWFWFLASNATPQQVLSPASASGDALTLHFAAVLTGFACLEVTSGRVRVAF